MAAICQRELPVRPWADPRLARLPGLVPVEPGEWLQVDTAYGAQIARRRELLKTCRDKVLQVTDGAGPGLEELFGRVLAELPGRAGFRRRGGQVRCPDGRVVVPDPARPLESLAGLVQEDFCLLEKPAGGTEHVLSAALVCFPASWTLAEKIGRPLGAIHAPVDSYDPQMARRVQRLFDGVRPECPIWRANCLLYDDPELYQPRPEGQRRGPPGDGPIWVRIERQSIVKLKKTGSVVFSIHSYVLPLDRLAPEDRAAVLARAG